MEAKRTRREFKRLLSQHKKKIIDNPIFASTQTPAKGIARFVPEWIREYFKPNSARGANIGGKYARMSRRRKSSIAESDPASRQCSGVLSVVRCAVKAPHEQSYFCPASTSPHTKIASLVFLHVIRSSVYPSISSEQHAQASSTSRQT